MRKLKGRVAADGVERICTTDVFDALEVPMRRRPSLTVRVSKLMGRFGWTNIRARGLNPGSMRSSARFGATVRTIQRHYGRHRSSK